MTDSPTPSPKLVRVTTPCWTCGYDLRHLPVEQRCPECGTAISWTQGGYQLLLADRAWLHRVGRGCGVLAWSLSGLIVSGLAVLVAMFRGDPAIRAAVGVVVLVLLARAQVGIWLLTTPDLANRSPALDDDRRLRRWARGLALPGIGGAQMFVALWQMGQPQGEAWIWLLAAWLPGAGGFVLLLRVLATLAARLPEPALHRDLSRFGFIMAIYAAAVPVAAILPAVLGTDQPSRVVYGAAVILAFFLYVWFHVMLLELTRSIAADRGRGASAADGDRTAQFHPHREPS